MDIKIPNNNIDFWISAYRGMEIIFTLPMPKIEKYKAGVSVYDFFIPKNTVLPGSYIFSLGSTLKNKRWIVTHSQFDIFVMTTIQNNSSPIFTSSIVE